MMKLCPDVFPSTWVNPVLNYRRSATLTDPHPTATRQYVPKASHHPPNGGNSIVGAATAVDNSLKTKEKPPKRGANAPRKRQNQNLPYR